MELCETEALKSGRRSTRFIDSTRQDCQEEGEFTHELVPRTSAGMQWLARTGERLA